MAFRRGLSRAPRLTRRTVRVRGLPLAVYTSPAVPGVVPLLCINGGLLYARTLLWPALSSVRWLALADPVGVTSAWTPGLGPAALKRLEPPERIILERLEPAAASNHPDVQSAYSRALYSTWLADRDLAALFALPRSTSVTGAAVAARLRRGGYDWHPLLRGLLPPTLVIHGEADLLPISVAEETTGTIEGARLQIVPDAGHMPSWEAPERFFAAAEAFRSHDDPGTRP